MASYCLPPWRTKFLRFTANRTIVKSGCATANGRVQCEPEKMRLGAESFLRKLGLWRTKKALSLEAYTLARYTSSEIGSGTPEEKVAVMQCAINRAKLEKLRGGVVELLLFRRKGAVGYGAYGPIHGPGMNAPYGRWASTSRDPGIDDLLIADFVLSGKAGDFARGGDDQFGPGVEGDTHHPAGWALRSLPKKAESRNYWVGVIPGVDHWKTFIFRNRRDIAPTSELGKKLLAAGQQALSSRTRPDWSKTPVCKGAATAIGSAAAATGIAGGLLLSRWFG